MRITKNSMDNYNYERMKYRSWRTWIPSSKCSTSKESSTTALSGGCCKYNNYVLKRKKTENICLSRRTAVQRIEMMADDIKKKV
jgi:hypothetical protein